MDGNAFSMAITICLLGSSAASFAFGVLVHTTRAKQLESQLDDILENPESYHAARMLRKQKSIDKRGLPSSAFRRR